MMFRKGSPCKKSPSMKKLALMSFVLGLAMSLLVLAQETAKPGEMNQDTPKAEKTPAKAMNCSARSATMARRSSTKQVATPSPRVSECVLSSVRQRAEGDAEVVGPQHNCNNTFPKT